MNKCWIFFHLQVAAPNNRRFRLSEMKMRFGRNILYLLFSVVAVGQTQPQPTALPEARVSSFTIGADSVTVVHVRPGYVSSVRLPEGVSSVAIGNPKTFDAEHSEAEPRLVFLRPLSAKP